jgi:hypothetical protein
MLLNKSDMAYRIVQEKWKYGSYKYRVEHNNGLFGLRKLFGWWKTCKKGMSHYYEPAVFDRLVDAEQFIEDETNYITETNIMATYN